MSGDACFINIIEQIILIFSVRVVRNVSKCCGGDFLQTNSETDYFSCLRLVGA